MFTKRSVWLAALVGALVAALVFGAGGVSAKKKCRSAYCGTYAGKTKDATDPAGFTSGGGPFGFVVGAKGVRAVTADVTWNCSRNGGPIAPEPFHFDRSFKSHPIKVKKKGRVLGDRYFGDLHMSLDGRIKKGKFSGYFALGFLNGQDGCGTAPLPATATKK